MKRLHAPDVDVRPMDHGFREALDQRGVVDLFDAGDDRRDLRTLFVADANGGVHTAAWEPAFTDCWHGWWELRVAPLSS